MTNKQLFKIQVDKLSQIKGQGTTLVTLYVSHGKQIINAINHLRGEYIQSQNIKSRSTRHAVLTALQQAITIAKIYKRTPENGIAIFASDTQKYAIEPIEPITIDLYRCDNHFHLEPLLEMCKEKENFGIITIDENEATIALIKGATTHILHSYTSGAWGGHKKGGQSSSRFERIREEVIQHYLRRVAEHAIRLYDKEKDKISLVIVGGPSLCKHRFIKETNFQKLINVPIHFVDIGYTDENGVREAIYRSKEILKNAKITKESKVIEELKSECIKNNSMVEYGYDNIIKATTNGQVKTILVCEDKLNDEICELTERTKTEIVTITKETENYTTLQKTFNGIAAILRYKT